MYKVILFLGILLSFSVSATWKLEQKGELIVLGADGTHNEWHLALYVQNKTAEWHLTPIKKIECAEDPSWKSVELFLDGNVGHGYMRCLNGNVEYRIFESGNRKDDTGVTFSISYLIFLMQLEKQSLIATISEKTLDSFEGRGFKARLQRLIELNKLPDEIQEEFSEEPDSIENIH